MKTIQQAEYSAGRAYEIINGYTTVNSIGQGVAGIIGLGVALAADVAAFGLYWGMRESLNSHYGGRKSITREDFQAMLAATWKPLALDLIADKVLEQIPILSIPTNFVVARVITWRIGLFLTIVAAVDGEFPKEEHMVEYANLSARLIPRFAVMVSNPDIDMFKGMVARLDGKTASDAAQRAKAALEAMDKL